MARCALTAAARGLPSASMCMPPTSTSGAGSPAVAEGIARLRKVAELELRRGCDDGVVIGGSGVRIERLPLTFEQRLLRGGQLHLLVNLLPAAAVLLAAVPREKILVRQPCVELGGEVHEWCEEEGSRR